MTSKKDEPVALPPGSQVVPATGITPPEGTHLGTPVQPTSHVLKEQPTKAVAKVVPLDESIPGGKYLHTDGKTLINAYGQPIDEHGKILDETPVARG